jgi:DNA mismatch endonuclease (patch repair protein)
MTDVFTSEKRSSVMRAIMAKNTKPEMVLRQALHRHGFRFRLHDSTLAGKPDIVLPKYRTLIQVRGCFWHGHTCIDGHIPKSRVEYWLQKIRTNKVRDRRTDSENRRLGWSVLVVWECRLSGKAAYREIQRITTQLRASVGTVAEKALV